MSDGHEINASDFNLSNGIPGQLKQEKEFDSLNIQDIEKVLIENYRKLNVLFKHCKWHPTCPMKRFYEEGILDRKWIELYCKGDWESCIRYEMEESGKPHPDWMLPDGTIDGKLRKKGV